MKLLIGFSGVFGEKEIWATTVGPVVSVKKLAPLHDRIFEWGLHANVDVAHYIAQFALLHLKPTVYGHPNGASEAFADQVIRGMMDGSRMWILDEAFILSWLERNKFAARS